MRGVIFERAAKYDRRTAFGFDAFLNSLLNNARRCPHADVLPRLFPADGRKRSQVTLNQRLDRRQVETADEDKCEVARVGKAILVECQGFVEIPRVDRLYSVRAPSEVILISGGGE